MIEIKNAIIESVRFDMEHGCLSAWVFLDYGGCGQGFGGWVLYSPSSFSNHKKQGNYAGHFIWRVLQIAGVEDWGKLPGKTVRAKCEHSKIHAIGHIIRDDWFDPAEDFKRMEANNER